MAGPAPALPPSHRHAGCVRPGWDRSYLGAPAGFLSLGVRGWLCRGLTQNLGARS